jgi:starch-binding outer membrane protein, SusD/RagB family
MNTDMKKIITLFIVFAFMLNGCNDSFLEKYPLTSLVEETAFESYDNFKAYMYPLYDMFTTNLILTNYSGGYGSDSHYLGDFYAGYFEKKGTSDMNPYAWQTVPEYTTGNGWDFTRIRRINIMLSHIDACKAMTEAEKNHWKAVGYFFHSYWYMMLINRFGDVPWIEQVFNETSEEAYGERMPRKEVADKVLERLKWAEENIGNFAAKDGDNPITQIVIRAALSRFTLREGTWRKYHNLGDFDKYFTECARVSQLLMTSFPALYNGTDGQPAAGYGEMWTTEDLSKVPGVIFYKQYFAEVGFYNNGNHVERTSTGMMELPQHIVDMYLCKDGKTIANSPQYAGDKTMFATFRNRDPRLYHTVVPPYTVKSGKGDYPSWSFTTNIADREYLNIMGLNTSCSNPGVGMKRLPAQNWSASLVPQMPNFSSGSKISSTTAFVACRSGYYVWKHWNNWELNSNQSALNTSDKPIFKIEEVLLNYAECTFEQNAFSQAVADLTINKLRKRAGIDNLVVADINAGFDPKRDPSVDPVLWEIRRERLIELLGEGFGFDDVRRWKKAPWYINKQQYGQWTTRTVFSNPFLNMTTGLADNTLTEGYIFLYNNPVASGKGWLDKYYLYQVPTNEIVLNPKLTQNPGWN